jgi:DNA mismatch repair protein MutL
VERALEEAVREALGRLTASAALGPAAAPRPGAEPGAPAADGAAPGDAEGPAPDLFAAPGPATGAGSGPVLRAPTGPLVQLLATYVVFEGPDGMVLVDQHAAHERVLYERAMADLTGGRAAAQRLLLPITVELTDEELDQVEAFGDTLRAVGFEVEPFGGRTVVLHATPAPHPRFDATACFRELVADLARGRFGGWANRLERFAATYACRAAVKAGTPLAEPEMRALLAALFATRLPPHDVHGRATIVTVSRDELERRFGRR